MQIAPDVVVLQDGAHCLVEVGQDSVQLGEICIHLLAPLPVGGKVRSGGHGETACVAARQAQRRRTAEKQQLIIGGSKYIAYTLSKGKPGEPLFQNQTLPSTLVSFPVQIKFNSDRIGNFRTYLLAGLKYDYDLSSNSAARNVDDIIKLKANDIGFELGLGFNFYLPFVTVSPEIKISNGLKNIHQLDPALKYSNVLDQILSRMVVFSIHFED